MDLMIVEVFITVFDVFPFDVREDI